MTIFRSLHENPLDVQSRIMQTGEDSLSTVPLSTQIQSLQQSLHTLALSLLPVRDPNNSEVFTLMGQLEDPRTSLPVAAGNANNQQTSLRSIASNLIDIGFSLWRLVTNGETEPQAGVTQTAHTDGEDQITPNHTLTSYVTEEFDAINTRFQLQQQKMAEERRLEEERREQIAEENRRTEARRTAQREEEERLETNRLEAQRLEEARDRRRAEERRLNA